MKLNRDSWTAPARSEPADRSLFRRENENQQPVTDHKASSHDLLDNHEKDLSANLLAGSGLDFSWIPVYNTKSTPQRMNGAKPYVDIPVKGGMEEFVEQPEGGEGSPAGASPEPMSDYSCEKPISMNKVTSGPFLGGLTMDSYYPDLAGRGYYNHPDTAGTFDTGSRAGANVQLYSVIPSPCSPDQFHLEQTVTRTRLRRNGVADPTEGQTFDDIAKSGRNASIPPFRHDFLGGGTAPLGYIISMADPPSVPVSATDIERNLDFVTSLVGPGGRKSVSWSLSTTVTGGAVTNNVVS